MRFPEELVATPTIRLLVSSSYPSPRTGPARWASSHTSWRPGHSRPVLSTILPCTWDHAIEPQFRRWWRRSRVGRHFRAGQCVPLKAGHAIVVISILHFAMWSNPKHFHCVRTARYGGDSSCRGRGPGTGEWMLMPSLRIGDLRNAHANECYTQLLHKRHRLISSDAS